MDFTILRIVGLQVIINGNRVLRNISLQIKSGEQWAVFGETGSGKTVLANTLAGHHAYQGRITTPNEVGASENSVIVVGQQHLFRDLQNQTNYYYQQRYNSIDSEATMTVGEDLAVFEENRLGVLTKKDLLEFFHLDTLLEEPLIQLSNGENKRLQILKAVLQSKPLLILDEPFTGLDGAGRGLLDDVLAVLARSGQSLMLLSSRDHIPDSFNRYARLEDGNFIEKRSTDDIRIRPLNPAGTKEKHFPFTVPMDIPDFRHIVRMHQVQVQYGDKKVLHGIDWEVEKGGCWSLTGPNGAGKSTLLSLITADNPQAYANEIYLFDRKRGTGESIWEIKHKIGYLSPELQWYFEPAATAFSTIASGLFDTIGLFCPLNSRQEEAVSNWLRFLDCVGYAHRVLSSLPAGLQRLVLLARAMIKSPPLLILDEPCQGLDATQTRFSLDLIDRYCLERGAGLIFVSHYMEEFPKCISRHLRLDKGRTV